MFRWIVGKSLKFRYLVLALAVGLMYFGVGRIRQDAGGRVSGVRAAHGRDPDHLPRACGRGSRDRWSRLPWSRCSTACRGWTSFAPSRFPICRPSRCTSRPGTDLLQARQLVAERVAAVTPTLPTWAAPPVMLPPLSATSRMMKIGISSKKRSVIDLSMITYWTIRQRLLRVPGVANVAIWGERIEMLQVQVVPELMTKASASRSNEVNRGHIDALETGCFSSTMDTTSGPAGGSIRPISGCRSGTSCPVVQRSDDVNPDRLANMPVAVRNGSSCI